MTDKVTVVFEALNYFRKFNENEVVRVVILKNKNSLYDINLGIGTNKTIDKKITKEDKLIKEEEKVEVRNVNINDLNSILFSINMKHIIESDLEMRNDEVIRFQSIKNKRNGNNVIEVIFNKDDIDYEYLNQHLNGTYRNSKKYSYWGFYDKSKEELKELSKSLEMGEEVDLTSDVIKEKMRSAISNTLKSYNKYYEMLEFFKSKMYVNPIELAYSYSFVEYLNLAQSEQEKEMDDIDFGNTNLTMYLKKVLEYK